MNEKDGGPAFPLVDTEPAMDRDTRETFSRTYSHGGMTLRDDFAAKAFPAVYTIAMKEASEGSGLFQHDDWPVGLALDAYRMADAMLKARGK